MADGPAWWTLVAAQEEARAHPQRARWSRRLARAAAGSAAAARAAQVALTGRVEAAVLVAGLVALGAAVCWWWWDSRPGALPVAAAVFVWSAASAALFAWWPEESSWRDGAALALALAGALALPVGAWRLPPDRAALSLAAGLLVALSVFLLAVLTTGTLVDETSASPLVLRMVVLAAVVPPLLALPVVQLGVTRASAPAPPPDPALLVPGRVAADGAIHYRLLPACAGCPPRAIAEVWVAPGTRVEPLDGAALLRVPLDPGAPTAPDGALPAGAEEDLVRAPWDVGRARRALGLPTAVLEPTLRVVRVPASGVPEHPGPLVPGAP